MKYLEDIFRICNCPDEMVDLHELCANERDGAYGVAMMFAFLEGCRPSIEEFAKHLELTEEEVVEFESPYRRLQVSGLFFTGLKKFNARKDRGLQGWGSALEGRTAWCQVAGIGAGTIGAGYYIRSETAKPALVTSK